jgi:hypothetical protein
MKKIFILITVFLTLSVSARAHLCNDVFVQAKDNLVVKVDVRDGQLRISDTGSFNVYLLNTMDRDIEKIMLEIVSNDFDAEVAPSGDWRGHPRLRTTKKGGNKVCYEVKLTRKKKTKKGKYKIALLLHGGNQRKVFKTVDVNEAMELMDTPKKPSSLKVDGKVKSSEWKKALLCSSFYEYKQKGKYKENFPASQQTRFRFYHDKTNLYCLIDFQKKSKKGSEDIAKIYLAKNPDTKPQTVTVNLQKKEITSSGKSEGMEIKVDSKGTKAEIKLPLAALGLLDEKKEQDTEKSGEGDKKEKNKEDEKPIIFCVNLTREHNGATTYWKGNEYSVENPVVYANFRLAKKWVNTIWCGAF